MRIFLGSQMMFQFLKGTIRMSAPIIEEVKSIEETSGGEKSEDTLPKRSGRN
jgi:hypothetical protein